MRYLIVNADDLGLSRSVNRGVIKAHEDGIVTSASLMVSRPGALEAAEYARSRPQLDLGLHVELPRWRVSRIPRRGATYSEAALRRTARAQLQRQLERFRNMLSRDPTHLDSHQHRHLATIPRLLFERLADTLEIPLRRVDPRISFCGEFYGQDERGRPRPSAITPAALVTQLERLEEGVTELCCHPGFVADLDDWYRAEREQEVRSLCSPVVRDALRRLEIRLCTFPDATQVAREVAS